MIRITSMNPFSHIAKLLCIAGLALSFAFTPGALAQKEPHIAYVYPAGGQQGTTFEIMIGGQYLYYTTNVYVTGTGIQAEVTSYEPIITSKQASDLREKLKEFRKKQKTPDLLEEVTEIRKKLAAYQKRRANPSLAESIPVEITIAPNAPPGAREIRLRGPSGLSNPLVFQVGQLPEFRKPEPNPDDEQPLLKQFKKNSPTPTGRTNAPSTAITLPATINGQIQPAVVDRYRFTASGGQQLVVDVSARALIPYIADAVPGWFQAAVTLCDGKGNEVAYEDSYQFRPDPILIYKIPSSGEYILEIKDTLYRGREDFVYRISIGELPFLASIFPLGAKTGTQTALGVLGWNLPAGKPSVEFREPGMFPIFIRGRTMNSNKLPFAVDTLPEIFEKEPNNIITNAQPVTLPVIINGRVDKPGDMDLFRFDGQAGDTIVAEVSARRLDSSLDSVLKLTDATGKQLAFNDDHEDKGSGLNTHHADSYLTATLTANGTYFIHLGDTQRQGGWAYAYRLRLSAPRPDFELRAVPSSVTVRGNASAPITVFAFRRDGFTNDIAIALKDAPTGFKLTSARIPAGQDQIKITLSAPPSSTHEPVSIHLEGRATIQGREVVHPAVPADDMMQAFLYRHLVPSQEMKVSVIGKFTQRTPPKILTPMPIKISTGGTCRVQVAFSSVMSMGQPQFELAEGPEGITIKSATPSPDGVVIVMEADPKKVQPGMKGNLIVNSYIMRTKENGKPATAKRRISLGALPAISFETVGPTKTVSE